MSEMIDGFTARKINDFWKTAKPSEHTICMEVIFIRDEKIKSIESQLQRREEQLKIIKEALVHYSKGDGMLTYREDGNGIGYWNGDRAREALQKIAELEKTNLTRVK